MYDDYHGIHVGHSKAFSLLMSISTFLFILFASIAIACALYYLAELAEEYASVSKQIVKYALYFVSAAHIILMIFDDVLPFRNLFVGLACTSVYWAYFPTFPSIQLNSFAFIGGCASFVILHVNWYYFFQDHSFYFQAHEVLAFFQIFVWLIPFAFFISVSVNDTTLPTHAGANSAQLSVGGRSFGLKAVFAFFRNLATPDSQGVLPSSNLSSSPFGGDDSAASSSASSDFSSPAPYIPSAAASQYGNAAASALPQNSTGADVASAGAYHTQQDGGIASRYGASAHSAPAPVPLASAPQPFARPAPQSFASSASGLLRPMMHRGPVAPAGKSD